MSVTAPRGVRAAGTACGIKSSGKPDVALIVSDVPCTAAGAFTKNMVKAAPIYVSQDHLADGRLQSIVANSGNANALTQTGRADTARMTQAAALATGLEPEQFGVASTGVIGVPLPVERVERGIAAADGEGATRLVTVTVTGAAREDDAVRLARSVAGSSLVKAALCGADANWGRVLCAMGYAGVPFEPSRVSVRFSSSVGELLVCQGGVGVPFAEGVAETILDREEVTIRIDLGAGDQEATCWGCDLTPDYVRINGAYRRKHTERS